MKKSLCSASFVVASCFAGSFLSVAQSISSQIVDSNIDHVTVFPDSAQVTRHFSVTVPSGESLLQLDYLPSGLDASHLKAEIVKVSAPTIIRDISLLPDASDVLKYPALISLKNEISDLEVQVKQVQKQMDLQKGRLDYAKKLVDSFTSGYGTKAGELADLDSIDKTWAFYEKTHGEVEAVLKELEMSLKPYSDALQEKKVAYDQLLKDLKRATQSIGILVDSTASSSLELMLTYTVANCSWEPVYEVRAYPESEKVTVRYQVSVYQNTGENWENVSLTLSTARADMSSSIPELYPVFLNQYEPVLMRKASMKMEQEVMPMAMAVAPVADLAAPAFEANYSSYQVTLPQHFSMKSGADRKKSLIAERELKGEFWSVVAPKYSPIVYLAAEVKNEFEMPMLSGESVLFVDDQIVGRSYLNRTPVGEKIELALGINELVTAERKSGKLTEQDRGVFGKRTRISRQYFTIIENHSDREQRVVAKDQFPVSQNEKIEVNRITPSGNDVKLDENSGLFSWDLKLAPHAKRQLETRFDVTYPEDWNIPLNF